MEESHNDIIALPETGLPVPSSWQSNPYLPLATSENTRVAYRSDIKHYEQSGGKLPAAPLDIAAYLQTYAAMLNPRTLRRRLIAIKHWHTYQGFPDPTLHPVIGKTMQGILRVHGKPKAKARALTIDELTQIHLTLINNNTLASIRDDALLQIGFFGAMRRSELVNINVEHIRWDKAGIEILLPTSKTDQTHEGQYCVIPYGNKTLCAIAAIKLWLNHSGITQGPLFRRITLGDHIGNKALTPLSVNLLIKERAREANIKNLGSISSHSLRRGLATNAARAGAPLQVIMRAGRWKQTNTVMEYMEEIERFKDNAADVLLKTLKD